MSEVIPQSEYRRLLLSDRPLIDLRAPVEFAKGAFPAARNLPLMTDSEREAVGTRYKEQGQEAAIALGHQLVHGPIKQARIDAWLEQVTQYPDTLLYCFRGGLRSQLSQRWLAEAGVMRPYIEGGYKGMRGYLIGETDRVMEQGDLVILGGMTGCGKTDFLNARADSVDLEGIANHRGSSFGRRIEGQPSQIDFENQLAIALMRHQEAGHRQLLLEDESRLIGRESIPLPLFESMTQAPRVMLEVDNDARIAQITKDYVTIMAQDYLALDPETGFAQFEAYLLGSLDRIRRRLGGALHQDLRDRMCQALAEQQRSGEVESHRGWISMMLTHYYDPMYRYQLEKQTAPVLFQGPPQAVHQFLDERGA
ncbi:tRNA 2-selenouridine(34) synthase MnmH [Ferrimonas balearica]|uniref:tRNA 2-selenouridine(34) synthase MnmH n=1 Tax=Ferrimonas balearica TaxID=44012 RepID=UPI001C99E752|nr:tRNA 2-selenouridine(34) synthase MnmH [Ferrimonas balearica]MBY5923514.1 tRNA 2-selenouridine(34) synthase MnmH [Ferrimonas balearica]MBY5997937.1 tRNA 2-selenouridine(34) synthase MnmH [Ferrimonas balearica]